MSKNLDSKTLALFLDKAVNKLTGRWILIGGTLLPAVGIDIRSTVDIELIGLGKNERSMSLELMNLADNLDLNIEAINQAADFFLQKIKFDESDLVILQQSKNCKIFRPSASLYLRLKMARLTESDLQDAIEYFKFCRRSKDDIKIKDIKNALRKEQQKKPTEEKLIRLNMLEELVNDELSKLVNR